MISRRTILSMFGLSTVIVPQVANAQLLRGYHGGPLLNPFNIRRRVFDAAAEIDTVKIIDDDTLEFLWEPRILEDEVRKLEKQIKQIVEIRNGLVNERCQTGEVYVHLRSGGAVSKRDRMVLCDTPDQAIESWLLAARAYIGIRLRHGARLYWRSRPELCALELRDGMKYIVCSRFIVTSEPEVSMDSIRILNLRDEKELRNYRDAWS